jgi:hypothetical protein
MANPRPRDRGGETSAVLDRVIQEVNQLPALKSLSAERLVEMASQMGDFLANRIRLKTKSVPTTLVHSGGNLCEFLGSDVLHRCGDRRLIIEV